jgi:phage terminase large subunit-like protein
MVRDVLDFAEFCERCGLTLEPFQRRIAKAIQGPERECVILIARDNGKSSIVAAVCLYWLVTEQEDVFAIANSRDQAHVILGYAKKFARELDNPHVVERFHDLRFCPDPSKPSKWSRQFRALAADPRTLHGLKGRFVYDELHMAASDETYLAGRTSSERANSKIVVVSTAAASADSTLGRLRARALASPDVKRRGCLTDARGDNIRMLAWEADPEAASDDMRIAAQCNPASWIGVASLRRLREALPDAAWRRYHLNIHGTASESAWIAPALWQACKADYAIEPGEEVWVGVDIGAMRALSAVVWVTADLRVGVETWQGEESILFAQDCVERLAGRFQVREVAADPWHAGPMLLDFQARGITALEYPQRNERMAPASERLRRAVQERRLQHPGDEHLDRAASLAIAKTLPRGWRIDRADKGGRDQIDPLVALCMAVDRAEAPKPEPLRFLGWL